VTGKMREEQPFLRDFSRPLRILFIGNSHTYRHDVPATLVRLAGAAEPAAAVTVETRFGEGASLAWHWGNPETVQVIGRGKWDYVVLQERSGGPIEDRLSMEKHALLLDRRIRDAGARTILYMTWPRRDKPEMQGTIAAAYCGLQARTGALLAPVGFVWARCRSTFPDLDLHDPDGRHANVLGAYLSACTFFALIFRRSPEGLAATVLSPGEYSSFGGKERLSVLERIAHEITGPLRQPS